MLKEIFSYIFGSIRNQVFKPIFSCIYQKLGTNALLLTIGFSHLILALPNAVSIALDVDILVANPVPLYFTAAKAMYYLNYAGDFLLYTMGGSIIRNEIRLMFQEVFKLKSFILFHFVHHIR